MEMRESKRRERAERKKAGRVEMIFARTLGERENAETESTEALGFCPLGSKWGYSGALMERGSGECRRVDRKPESSG